MYYKIEHQKISKLLSDSTLSKSVTRKSIKANDLLNEQYSVNQNIRFKTAMLRSDSCDYSDTYIGVKGRITVAGTNANNRTNEELTFKNNSPFRLCISKINSTIIDNAEDIDIVMSMYNLSENNDMTSGSLWSYYRDEGMMV